MPIESRLQNEIALSSFQTHLEILVKKVFRTHHYDKTTKINSKLKIWWDMQRFKNKNDNSSDHFQFPIFVSCATWAENENTGY